MTLSNPNTTGNEGNHRVDGLTVHNGLLLTGPQGASAAIGVTTNNALTVANSLILAGSGGASTTLSVDANNNLLVGGSQASPLPGLPNILAAYDPRLFSGNSTFSSNAAYGQRVVVHRTGTIADLAIFIGTQSGNIDVGIYDATVTPRNKLYSLGTTACPASAAAWQTIASPNLAVTRGQVIDLVIAVDNATAQFGRFGGSSGGGKLPAASWLDSAPDTFAQWTAAASFVLPATITPAVVSSPPLVIARLV